LRNKKGLEMDKCCDHQYELTKSILNDYGSISFSVSKNCRICGHEKNYINIFELLDLLNDKPETKNVAHAIMADFYFLLESKYIDCVKLNCKDYHDQTIGN
jgi:hypothetical protein